MHEIQTNLLWIGHAFDIRALDSQQPRALFEAGIEAVVDVAYEEAPAYLPRQLIYCRFPLNDGGGNEPAHLLQCVQTLGDFLSSGTRTLVACSAGMSRSPTIAAFALAKHLSQTPDEILVRIAEKRSLEIKPSLWSDVENIFAKLR
ncbi:MAG: dual specificity protein phosphatase [Planctomycetota bacterium]